MLEPLAMGSCTLKAEVSDDRMTRNSQGRIGTKRGARKQERQRQRSERDDRPDVPASARRKISKQSASSILR